MLQGFRKSHQNFGGIATQMKSNFTQLIPAPQFMLPLPFAESMSNEPISLADKSA